jgi:predicted PurR-regulated permease PerM
MAENTTEPNTTEKATQSQPDRETSQKPEKKQRKWDWVNKQWAATIIFSGVVLLLIAFLFIRYELFTNLLSYLMDVLRPILIGLLIAFLLYRPTCRLEQLFEKCKKRFPRFPAPGMAVFSAYALMALLLAAIIWIIVPQFIASISDFGDNVLIYYNNVMELLNSEKGSQILKVMNENGFDPTTLRTKLLDFSGYIPTAVGTLSVWAKGLIGGLIDFLIGLIFSIYVLAGRQKLRSQGLRILKHYLPEKHYRRLGHYGTLTFTTFSNYISGRLTDAFVIGILTFFVNSIAGIEYPMMIAVIVGITNIIPFVGPWLGAIPSILILLMVNPIHALAFTIIILIIQQLDGNVISPLIVGSSIGLPAIWVLFAITVGGGLFGLWGMLLGVPVMSVIYTVIREKTTPEEEWEANKPKKVQIFGKLWQGTKKLVQKLRK